MAEYHPQAKEHAGGGGLIFREVTVVAAAVFTFVCGLWLIRGEPGMTWDEPYFFERQHDIFDWLKMMVSGPDGLARAWSTDQIGRSWKVCRAVPDQHGPVPELASLITGLIFRLPLGPLRAYRFSTVMIFACTAGVMFRFVRARWGPIAALASVGALVCNPRILGDAQLITADSDLGAFWFLAAVAYLRAVETGRAPWLFGVLVGFAIMCKVMGVLVLPAIGFWAIVVRPLGWWRPLVWGAVSTPLTMVALNPGWWPAPITGILRWAMSFLTYPQKVPVYYLGKTYDSVTTFLPWHNTVVLTSVMVPVGILILGVGGLLAVGTAFLRHRAETDPTNEPGRISDRAIGLWAAINFLILMVMRTLSFMPAHDGLRQLVPAFYFLPILVGFAIHLLARGTGTVRRRFTWGVLTLGIGSAAISTMVIHPYELAYYNTILGGPIGAKSAGMETTYFWDAATDEVLQWMNKNLPLNATVLIFPPPNVLTFGWEQRWGRLRRDLKFLNLDTSEGSSAFDRIRRDPSWKGYMIVMQRQGVIVSPRAGDRSPFIQLADSPALYELAPSRVGVRLLAIFDQDQVRKELARGSTR